PLSTDLVTTHHRASPISIVPSGLLHEILFARVISGIIKQYTTWRESYYLAIAMHSIVF
ncbi:hypothetical protein BXZ70DRAFT_863232, partial [Cristinia sonorae]